MRRYSREVNHEFIRRKDSDLYSLGNAAHLSNELQRRTTQPPQTRILLFLPLELRKHTVSGFECRFRDMTTSYRPSSLMFPNSEERTVPQKDTTNVARGTDLVRWVP